MSNTTTRILSALVLVAIVVTSVSLGKVPTLLFCLVAGVFSIDELLTKFSNLKRSNSTYIFIQMIFSALFCMVNFSEWFYLTKSLITIIAIFFNFFLIYYLFKIPLDEKFMKKNNEKYLGIISILIILPLLSFGIHFQTNSWRQVLALLLIVTFSMDTGAWFFGRNFGKHKLWPAVSPNKTIEGLVGGMFTSSIIGTISWYFLFNQLKWECSVIFAICGVLSQVGDLIQSKIKREFQIKDSSNLIPGHGGVYDRIDSLIFLSPFFVVVVKYLQQQISL